MEYRKLKNRDVPKVYYQKKRSGGGITLQRRGSQNMIYHIDSTFYSFQNSSIHLDGRRNFQVSLHRGSIHCTVVSAFPRYDFPRFLEPNSFYQLCNFSHLSKSGLL